MSKRTFFRRFPDKREVLFDGGARLRTALTATVAGAPADLGPRAGLLRAFQSVRPMLEGNRPFAHATPAWLDDPDEGLGARLNRAFHELRAMLADRP